MMARRKGATNLVSITFQLAKYRLENLRGEGITVGLTIVSFAIVSAITYLVATGTYMFYQRSEHADQFFGDLQLGSAAASAYVLLSALALSLLLGPLVNLAGLASVLAATSRETRLAGMRLLGVSNWAVMRIAALETMLQAAAGAAIGLLAAFLALPALKNLSFQGIALSWQEMFMPPAYYGACALAIILFSGVAAVFGLRRVIVSPLGVSRKALPRRPRLWRVVLLLTGIGAAYVIPVWFTEGGISVGVGLVIAIILLLVAGFSAVMPLLLRLVARIFTAAKNPVVSVAMWRIVASPRNTWRRVSGVGILSFIAAIAVLLPASIPGIEIPKEERFVRAVLMDVRVGALLTILFGFILAAGATLLSSMSHEFEHLNHSYALARMGAKDSFALKVSAAEAIIPVAGVCLLGYLLGSINAGPLAIFFNSAGTPLRSASPVLSALVGLGVVVAGIAMVSLATAITIPIHRQIMARHKRRAD
ncbi:efflux ABC transporter, permease protein [Winkia neuii]|nr:efflux ABC transporter, permease protein [Winkia neuii]